jgi:hypothetical protein
MFIPKVISSLFYLIEGFFIPVEPGFESGQATLAPWDYNTDRAVIDFLVGIERL